MIITCISPSVYNGSETAFTVDFGERFSHLSTHPIPCPLENFENLVKKTRASLKENFEAVQKLENSPAGRYNRIYPLRVKVVQARASQLEFLESLMVSNGLHTWLYIMYKLSVVEYPTHFLAQILNFTPHHIVQFWVKSGQML